MYSDIANTLELPSYGVWSAGMIYNLSERWQLQASVDHISNEIGLSEGGPRSGCAENPGTSDFFYARPIVGRNVLFSVTCQF